jgi:hypothetical protein
MPDESTIKLKPTCLHLRHKMMYVDAREQTPGLVDDRSDTRIYFCVKSQESLGPDGESVSPKQCTNSRNCFCHG